MTPTGRYWLLTLVVLTLCVLVFAPAVVADSQVRIVRLSFIDGPVQIDRNVGQGFERAILNMPIVQGTRLQTQEDGKAEVEFEDGSTLRLGPDTLLQFTELALRSNGGKVNAVTVEKGVAYFDIAHRQNDEFRVHFAENDIVLDRAAKFRLTLDNYGVEVADFKGDLQIQGPQEASLKKGQTLTINPDDQKVEIAKGIQQDPLDEWVKSREQYRDRYASNASYGAPYRGYYGLADLSYYGSYYDLPGYGWAWRPYGRPFGWDPFMDGAWCWYPAGGYTWVSAYPWGWIPFRYGSWFWDGRYGWLWSPYAGGGWYWNQPNWNPGIWTAVPPVIKAPPTYQPPRPPTSTPINTVVTSRNPATPNVGPQRRTDAPSVGAAGPAGQSHPTVWVRGGVLRQPGDAGISTPSPSSVPSIRTQPGMAPNPRGDAGVRPAPAMARPGRGMNRMDRNSSPSSTPSRGAPSPRIDSPRPSAPAPRMESPRPSSPMPRMESPRSAPSSPRPPK